MGSSKYNQTEIKLNGNVVAVPREFFDIGVKASFDQNPQGNITTDSFTFVLDAFQAIKQYIEAGKSNGVGIFEGMPITISANGRGDSVGVFNGIVDLQDGAIINNESGEIQANIKQDNGLNNLADLIEPLDYGYLLELGVITESDYVSVDYVVVKTNNTIEVITLSITLYLMTKQLADSIRDLAVTIATISGITASGVPGIVGATIYAIATAIAQAIYAAALLVLIIKLGEDLIELLIQPQRTHKAITVKTLLEKTCEHIGYSFNTTVEDLDNLVYLPSNNNVDDYSDSIFLQLPGTIKKGIPNVTDIGYRCAEMFQIARDLFNGRFLIDGNSVQFHSENATYWVKDSPWIKPDVLKENGFRYNTDELTSSININLQTDIVDEYTISNFTGTAYQVLTDAKIVNNVQHKTIKNAEQVAIPCALGNSKESLNGLEKFLKEIAVVIDKVANTFGGGSNLKSKITNKIGALKVGDNNHSVPKLLWLDGGRIPSNHRDLFSAKTLWDKYHNEKSFIQNNHKRQRVYYENERVPFGFDDFVKVIDNSYFKDVDGKDGKIVSLEWTMNKDTAIISYWQEEVYTKNLKETLIEP